MRNYGIKIGYDVDAFELMMQMEEYGFSTVEDLVEYVAEEVENTLWDYSYRGSELFMDTKTVEDFDEKLKKGIEEDSVEYWNTGVRVPVYDEYVYELEDLVTQALWVKGWEEFITGNLDYSPLGKNMTYYADFLESSDDVSSYHAFWDQSGTEVSVDSGWDFLREAVESLDIGL